MPKPSWRYWAWLGGPPLAALAVGLLARQDGAETPVWLFCGIALVAERCGRQRGTPPATPAWAWAFHPRPRRAGASAANWLTLGVGTAFVVADPALFPAAVRVALAVVAVWGVVSIIAGPVRRVARGVPVLQLRPDALEVRGRRLPWDDIELVELNGSGDDPRLEIQPKRRGRRRDDIVLRPWHVDVNLVYLLDLVGYYAAHRDRRWYIGRPGEAERVHAALLSARLTVPDAGPTPVPVAD